MNGGTPLTRAIESSRENVVNYLIGKGVKIQTENKKGKHYIYVQYLKKTPYLFEYHSV